MAKATVKKIDDDNESPEATEEALRAGSGPEAGEKPRAKEDGSKGFTADVGFVLDATSLPLLEDETKETELDGKTLKGLKLRKGEEVMSHAVRGGLDDKMLVVTTTAGRKLARKL